MAAGPRPLRELYGLHHRPGSDCLGLPFGEWESTSIARSIHFLAIHFFARRHFGLWYALKMARWNRSLTWLAAMILMLVTASGTSNADPPAATSHANESASDLFVPRRHQFDLELSNISGIVDNSSLIRRREASIAGS